MAVNKNFNLNVAVNHQEMKNLERPQYQMQNQPQDVKVQASKEPEKLDFESGEIDPYA